MVGLYFALVLARWRAKRNFDRTLTQNGNSIALCRIAKIRSHFDMVSGWMGTIESRSIIPDSPTDYSPSSMSATRIDRTPGGNSIALLRFEGTDTPNHNSIAHSTF
ncbi:hypothetical protein [Microcoleus sp. OTE_8_concoct_300]|uniref:hypothetical protein n=1 Tax=Microcoleus sp. OTE_8_concoct_300 TaxID=2964710 RepID=UPI00403F619F